jgi:uncharacterized DUF497 family protein
MGITFDPRKSAKNVADRGLSFDLVERLDWSTAVVSQDKRRDYGEVRLQVTAMIDDRLYRVVVTPRGDDLRMISLRCASKREAKAYAQRH